MKVTDIPSTIVRKFKKFDVYPNLGGDPEFFVADKKAGKILSASDFFPGKEKPIIITENLAGKMADTYPSKLFFDGIQAEIAPTPTACREYLVDNYRACLKAAYDIVDKTSKMLMRPSVKVQRAVIDNAHPEARIFGCAPDFNAYTCGVNTCAMDASKHPFRYAGGHIHLGVSSVYLKKDSPEYLIAKTEQGHLGTIKMLDLFVGVLSVLLDNSPASTRRRSKYGKAGCFRPTPYGVEYRTMSCFWLKSPMLVSLMYGMARLAWNVRINGEDDRVRKLIGCDEETVRGIIDESDVVAARKLWAKIRPVASIMGCDEFNPVNYRNTLSDGDVTLDRRYKIDLDKVVNTSAALQYLIENGIDAVLKAPEVEWELTSDLYEEDGCIGFEGFRNHCINKFLGNKDFVGFQKHFLAEAC